MRAVFNALAAQQANQSRKIVFRTFHIQIMFVLFTSRMCTIRPTEHHLIVFCRQHKPDSQRMYSLNFSIATVCFNIEFIESMCVSFHFLTKHSVCISFLIYSFSCEVGELLWNRNVHLVASNLESRLANATAICHECTATIHRLHKRELPNITTTNSSPWSSSSAAIFCPSQL